MDKAKIDGVFQAAVKAKVEKSMALGSKATWGNDDQLGVATECVMQVAGLDKDDAEMREAIRAVVQATYNHSAMAQKLEKAFAGTGHFQRESKQVKKENQFAGLLAQIEAEAKAKGLTA